MSAPVSPDITVSTTGSLTELLARVEAPSRPIPWWPFLLAACGLSLLAHVFAALQ